LSRALVRETVELPGGRSQVVFRAGGGPPLVWLHGIDGVEPGHPLVERLAGRHEVVCPLAPGFEDIGALDDVDDVHELAIHYDDVFEALDLVGVPVVGHSFGAMVAAELAAHFPKRVGSLVLLAPLGLWRDDEPVADMFAVRFTDLPSLLYADPEAAERAAPRVQIDVEAHVRRAQAMTTVAKFVWPIPDRGLRRRLYRITAPTLAVFGELDRVVPASYAEDFAGGIKGARTAVVPGAGHMLPVERSDEVAAAIDAFL
jgi:pimeloyl-ACP methyl ester carboxylesterase